MKQILLCFFFIGCALKMSAYCSSEGLWAYPTSPTISQGSFILLEGYAESQSIIAGLNEKYPVYLKSKGHQVRLEVVETSKGAMRLRQAVLRAKEPLIPGKIYQLAIDHLSKEEQGLLYKNGRYEDGEPFSWMVTEALIAPPAWKKTPALVDTETMWFGCGPSVNAVFELEVADRLTTLVRTELLNLETQEKQTYFLFIDEKNKLSVGHGMCSGAFTYRPDQRYQVQFKLMNYLGEEDKAWTDWIAFDSPYRAYAHNRD